MRAISFFIILSIVTCLNTDLQAKRYAAPDLNAKFIDVDALTIDEATRVDIATNLGALARESAVKRLAKKHIFICPKLLGIALKIDKINKVAYIANSYYKKGRTVPAETSTGGFKKTIETVMKLAAVCKTAGSEEDVKLAAYIYSLIAIISPSNQDAVFESEVYLEDNVLDWEWADGIAAENEKNNSNGSTLTQNDDSNVDFKKRLSKIKGLMVITLANGEHAGMASDIILSAQPLSKNAKNGSINFARSNIGKDMKVSLNEALRTVQAKYPFWVSYRSKISFGDKYSSKDGGSAGLAFTILIFSLIEGFDIDPAFAITGDITVDGKIREVGGVSSKITGAKLDKCSYVIIPKQNHCHPVT